MAGNGRPSTTHQWILFMTGSFVVTLTTTKHNLIVHNSKSEAEVTNNKRLGSMYCTLEVTERHEASRGLSVRAEQLVVLGRQSIIDVVTFT